MTSATINQAREAIYARWVANIPSEISTNYVFANEKFAPPTDAPWARLIVSHEQGNQESLGPVGERKFLRRARVLIQLFNTVDSGLRSLDTIADAARDIFEGVSFSGLHFNSVDIRESGQDGEWYQVIVDAPFFYAETK